MTHPFQHRAPKRRNPRLAAWIPLAPREDLTYADHFIHSSAPTQVPPPKFSV